LVEFSIVASAVIIFLILFLPTLSKVNEARFKTLQASRYAAWERTIYYDKSSWSAAPGVTKTAEKLREETNLRILAQSKDKLGSEYKASFPIDAFLFVQNRNKLLGAYEEFIVNQNGSTSGIPRYLSLRESNKDAPSLGIDLGGKTFTLANLPDLPINSFYSAYAMLELKSLRHWKEFDQIIAPEDTNVILADGWSAGTGVSLQQKVKEGLEIKLNNAEVEALNATGTALNITCVGIGVLCGRNFKSDVLTQTSTLPQYVPKQRLE